MKQPTSSIPSVKYSALQIEVRLTISLYWCACVIFRALHRSSVLPCVPWRTRFSTNPHSLIELGNIFHSKRRAWTAVMHEGHRQRQIVLSIRAHVKSFWDPTGEFLSHLFICIMCPAVEGFATALAPSDPQRVKKCHTNATALMAQLCSQCERNNCKKIQQY